MSLDLIEQAAARLGPLLEDVAFLGGASLALWADDPGSPEPRVTIDVDVIAIVDSRASYYLLAERLRQQGLREDAQSRVLCRWKDEDGLIIDLMPTDPSILGFSNRWYQEAIETAELIVLPSGAQIRAVNAPLLLATKLEAFGQRGRGDYLASADFEDIVRLIDGRERLADEIRVASADVRAFVAAELTRMMSDPDFEAAIAGALLPDAASQGRRATVLERLRRIRTAATNRAVDDA